MKNNNIIITIVLIKYIIVSITGIFYNMALLNNSNSNIPLINMIIFIMTYSLSAILLDNHINGEEK